MGLFDAFKKKSAAVQEAEKCLARLDAHFMADPEATIAYSEISEELHLLVKDNPALIEERIDGAKRSPDLIFLAAISGLTEQGMTTGENHIYRGVLNTRGLSMRRVWKMASAECVRLDFLSDDDVEERLADLDDQITQAG